MAEVGVSSEVASQAVKQAESSKWSFLKSGLNKIRNTLRRNNSSTEQVKPASQPVKVPEANVQKQQETPEQKAAKIGVDPRLYNDFIKYLQDPQRIGNRQLAVSAEQALNNGDKDMINTLAHIFQKEYGNEIRQQHAKYSEDMLQPGGEFRLKVKAREGKLNASDREVLKKIEYEKGELAVKLALAKSLATITSHQVKQEQGREVIGGFMDIGIALSDKKESYIKKASSDGESIAEAADRYVRGIQTQESQLPKSPPPQK